MPEHTLRQPNQQRARDTLARILDAGAELVTEKGYAGFGVSDVCRRAGVSAGGLYRYFASKEGLVLAVQDRELGRLDADMAAALAPERWRDVPAAQVLEGAVRALAEQYRSSEAMLRAFIMHSGADPEMRAHASHAVRAGMRAHFVGLLLGHADELKLQDPEDAIDACFRVVFAALSWRVGFGADFESDTAHLDWDAWIDYLAAAARKLLSDEPG
jgi:AcrR family transcriptional regulator